MNCEKYSEWIGEAVDGTLKPAEHAELEAHCRECADCSSLLSDLKEIRTAAASLERLHPSPEVWRAIAARTEQPRRAFAPSWTHLAAAAALLIMVGAAAWFGLTTGSRVGGGDNVADLTKAAASELQLAEQHYLNAISSLEKLTVRRDATLDPVVAAEIAESLKSIDRAIDDSRAALKTDPRSFVAQTSLLEALRMKVALLQETVSLINAS